MLKGVVIDIKKLRREMAADRKGAEIARRLGMNRTYLQKKLSGTVAMTLEDLNNICREYGRSATEFIKEVDLECAA
jgi:transcriptional regulator with XRE-family HTH domain